MAFALAGVVSAQLAFAVVPASLERQDTGPIFWLASATVPVFWLIGALRRSASLLLGAVPLALVSTAYGRSHETHALAGIVAVITLAGYIYATALALRRDRTTALMATIAPSVGAKGPILERYVYRGMSVFLTAGPAVGLLVYPDIARVAASTYGELGGLAATTFALGATLIGLVLAAELDSERRLRRLRRGRAGAYAACLATCLLTSLYLRG